MYIKGKMGVNTRETWHQLTLKFNFITKDNKDVTKYNIMERREIDSMEKDWRICYLE